MTYNLVINGSPTDTLSDVAGDPNPLKGMVWLPFVDERNPVFNVDSHKLGPVTKLVENGNAVWRRVAVAKLSEDLKQAISQEAERRLEEGVTLSSGTLFKCDNGSINRIQGMLHGSFPKTFRTSAGVVVTIPDAATGQAVVIEVANYVAAVLEASSDLQGTLPNDFANDLHWP